jgi:hypothetical protein
MTFSKVTTRRRFLELAIITSLNLLHVDVFLIIVKALIRPERELFFDTADPPTL